MWCRYAFVVSMHIESLSVVFTPVTARLSKCSKKNFVNSKHDIEISARL
jgi:hypothetical protein